MLDRGASYVDQVDSMLAMEDIRAPEAKELRSGDVILSRSDVKGLARTVDS